MRVVVVDGKNDYYKIKKNIESLRITSFGSKVDIEYIFERLSELEHLKILRIFFYDLPSNFNNLLNLYKLEELILIGLEAIEILSFKNMVNLKKLETDSKIILNELPQLESLAYRFKNKTDIYYLTSLINLTNLIVIEYSDLDLIVDYIIQLPKLKYLEIDLDSEKNKNVEIILNKISMMGRLEYLDIGRDFDTKDLKILSNLKNLKKLEIINATLIYGFKYLEELKIYMRYENDIIDEGLSSKISTLRNLTNLKVNYIKLNDYFFECIGECENLTFLEYKDNYDLNKKNLTSIRNLKLVKLEILGKYLNFFKNDTILSSSIKILKISSYKINCGKFNHISKLPKLEELHISSAKLSPKIFKHLPKNIHELYFAYCKFRNLYSLSKKTFEYPHLKILYFNRCKEVPKLKNIKLPNHLFTTINNDPY